MCEERVFEVLAVDSSSLGVLEFGRRFEGELLDRIVVVGRWGLKVNCMRLIAPGSTCWEVSR